MQERDPPPTLSQPYGNDFDKKVRKVIKNSRESPRRMQDTARTKHRSVSTAKTSTEVSEKKHVSKFSDSSTLQKTMKENSFFPAQQPAPCAENFAVCSKSDFLRSQRDSNDEKMAEPQSVRAELQRQERALSEAISNRLERKHSVSVKTKKAVLKAIMCSSPDKHEDSGIAPTSNFAARNPNRQPTQVGKAESQNQGAPHIPTNQAGNNVFPPLLSLMPFGVNADQKANQTPAWLQKARTTFGKPHAREVDMPKSGNFHRTSKSQQRLWLKEALKAISDARVAEVSAILRPALRPHSELQALEDSALSPKSSLPETSSSPRRVAFMKTAEEKVNPQSVPAPPAASFMSSDGEDDDDSVSSVVLLFNYLSCNAVPDRKLQINHRGNLVLVESFESEHISLVQDYSTKQRRFPKYQLVCSQ